ncbi:DUF4232 domain-containing protein [Streptomyces lydicus]|uniref:DUF4232 domain-containing protein n=1 Tax=Streptomyces lydicus TaxID=47763 RepID=UPI001011D92F|nr:DUF4232 domain-containing protein [Streptomyces lydicus]
MSSSATVRTARRRTLRIAAAVLTAAAGLTLTACSGADATGAKPAGRVDSGAAAVESNGTGSSAGAQESDAQAGSGAKADAQADAKPDAKVGGTGKGSGSAQAGGGGGAGVQRCHTSGLKAAFATGGDAVPDPDASGGTTASIVLTNKGSSSCKIGGFPGVDLKSENGGERWSLARSSKAFSSITLQPGDSTDFTLNLAMTKEETGFYQPAYADVTPPNETTSLTVEWPWGTLVDQRGATHPGTFVNPIG